MGTASTNMTRALAAIAVALFGACGDSGPQSDVQGTPTSVRPLGTSRIAFDSDRDGGEMRIHTMRPDGSDVSLVTSGLYAGAQPYWSPDTARLALIGVREENGHGDIYVMDADGATSRVTDGPGNEVFVGWSPDGEQLAFGRGFFRPTRGPELMDVYIINVDGTGELQLTDNDVHDVAPRWSPSGEKIVYSSDRYGPGNLFVINPSGSGLQQLTNSPTADATPRWSPDGSRIAFARGEAGSADIYVMDADGSNITQ